jgi:hypothetical protein
MRVFYATIIFVMTTASAAVPVDITGVWRVRLHSEGFADDFCTWALVGSSSGEVVGYQSACLFPQNAGPISGTIDAGTGAFDLFFDVPWGSCMPELHRRCNAPARRHCVLRNVRLPRLSARWDGGEPQPLR